MAAAKLEHEAPAVADHDPSQMRDANVLRVWLKARDPGYIIDGDLIACFKRSLGRLLDDGAAADIAVQTNLHWPILVQQHLEAVDEGVLRDLPGVDASNKMHASLGCENSWERSARLTLMRWNLRRVETPIQEARSDSSALCPDGLDPFAEDAIAGRVGGGSELAPAQAARMASVFLLDPCRQCVVRTSAIRLAECFGGWRELRSYVSE
jgi:hypothetical protein